MNDKDKELVNYFEKQAKPSKVYQKPLPFESVHKHLAMLVNYLNEQSIDDRVLPRREARRKVVAQLERSLHSRAMQKLLEYGE